MLLQASKGVLKACLRQQERVDQALAAAGQDQAWQDGRGHHGSKDQPAERSQLQALQLHIQGPEVVVQKPSSCGKCTHLQDT